MRLAVIADIHGNLPALEAVLADIARRNTDLTVDLGDCVSGPLWPAETFALLQTLKLPTVRGNHDRALGKPVANLGPSDAYAAQALASGSWEAFPQAEMTVSACQALASLPPRLEPLPGVLACHGTPASDRTYLLEDVVGETLVLAPADSIAQRLGPQTQTKAQMLVLCGHSHQPRMVRSGDSLIVNPGSVGCPAYIDPGPPYHVSETGAPHARYALLDDTSGAWMVQFIAVEYDWVSAADRARRNGQPEWALALSTGRVR